MRTGWAHPSANGEFPARWGTAGVVLLSIAPFAFLPGMFDRWVFPKLLVALVGAGCALFTTGGGRLPRWTRWWLVAVAVVLVASAATGDAPVAQLLGRWPRYEGVVALTAYVMAMWSGTRLLGGEPPMGRLRALWGTTAVAAVAAALIAVLEAFGVHPIDTSQARAGSLFGNATDQGIVGVIVIAMLLPPAQRVLFGERGMSRAPSARSGGQASGREWSATTVWPGLAAGAVLVATSASRGALLALTVVLVVHLISRMFSRVGRSPRSATWHLPVLVAMTTALLVAVTPMARGRVSGATALSHDTVTNRFTMWRMTFDMLRGRLAGGVGPSGFEDAVNGYLPEDWFATVGEGAVLESPHNVALQVVSAGGAIAGILVLCLAAATVMTVWRRRDQGTHADSAQAHPSADLREGAVLAIIGWACALLTHFTAPGNTLMPAVLLGVLLAQPAAPPPVQRVRAPRDSGRKRPDGAASSRTRSAGWWAVLLVVVTWTAGLLGATVGDFALGRGVGATSAGRSEEADAAFGVASAWRPWDSDVALIASESFAAALDRDPDAGQLMADVAAAWSEEAVTGLPRSVRALKARAIAHQYQGDANGAIEDLTLAAEYAPTDPQVFQRLGALQAVSGNPAEGLRSVERAAQLDPDNEAIAQTLAFVRALGESGR